MMKRLDDVFEDAKLVKLIKHKLPNLFNIAELESSRAGKIGMEVGSVREKILIALLIYKFGENNVKTDIPITEPEIDVIVYDRPISIKTVTDNGRIKLSWTVDQAKSIEFKSNFKPSCDLLLAQIKWNLSGKNNPGGLFFIPQETQMLVLQKLGKDDYIKLPPEGTNPRGVELTSLALSLLLEHEKTKKIEIVWNKLQTEYNPYKRWVDYWKEAND